MIWAAETRPYARKAARQDEASGKKMASPAHCLYNNSLVWISVSMIVAVRGRNDPQRMKGVKSDYGGISKRDGSP